MTRVAQPGRALQCNGLVLNEAKTSMRDDRQKGSLPASHPLSDWPRNRLLLALPSRDLERLMAELEHVCCELGQTLMMPLAHSIMYSFPIAV
jgi:hypothetical protein